MFEGFYLLKNPKVIQIPIGTYQNTVYEWEGDGPALLFCHATGFHGRVWDRVIEKLDGYHCISIDLRGHGRSTNTEPPYPWDSFVPDVMEIIKAMGLENVIGVGHSMGGHVITSVATKMPSVVEGLVLCDPSLFVDYRYKKKKPNRDSEYSHPVAKRRNNWESPTQMYNRLIEHKSFAGWENSVLMDYCIHGLEKYDDHYRLSCPPIVEAAMYGAYIDPQVLEDLKSYKNPVSVLLARAMKSTESFDDYGPSLTRSDIGDMFPNTVVERYPDHSHFLPMEKTKLVASAIIGLLEGLNK